MTVAFAKSLVEVARSRAEWRPWVALLDAAREAAAAWSPFSPSARLSVMRSVVIVMGAAGALASTALAMRLTKTWRSWSTSKSPASG